MGDTYDFNDDFTKSIEVCYEELRKRPRETWPSVLERRSIRMKKVTWRVETGTCGCDLEGELELDDAATDEDIENAVQDDMWNYISLSWQIES